MALVDVYQSNYWNRRRNTLSVHSSTLQLDGINLHYRRHGGDVNLVCLHISPHRKEFRGSDLIKWNRSLKYKTSASGIKSADLMPVIELFERLLPKHWCDPSADCKAPTSKLVRASGH